MHNPRRTLEQRWSFPQATVWCFVDFDSVDSDSTWRIMATNGMPAKSLRLIKAHYASTKAKVGVNGGDPLCFEIRFGVRQGYALLPARLSYLKYFIRTFVGIHSERVEPASSIELTTSRTEALQAWRSCASLLETFTQSFLHRA